MCSWDIYNIYTVNWYLFLGMILVIDHDHKLKQFMSEMIRSALKHMSTLKKWKQRKKQRRWMREKQQFKYALCQCILHMLYSMALCSHIKKPLKEFKKQLVLLQVIFCVCKMSLVEIFCSEQIKIRNRYISAETIHEDTC